MDGMPCKGNEAARACDERKDADGTCERRTTTPTATHVCVAVMAEEDAVLGRTSSKSIAVPSSFGQWMGRMAENILDTLQNNPKALYVEFGVIIYTFVAVMIYIRGKRHNLSVARAWTKKFLLGGGIVPKNFSRLDTGQEGEKAVLLKESPHEFKFYASGRRFCESMDGSIQLKVRQDVVSIFTSILYKTMDTVTMDVFMNDESMDDFVFAVGKRKFATKLHKEQKDLNEFASIIDIPAEQKMFWPEEGFCAVAEFKETFGGIFDNGLACHILSTMKDQDLFKHLVFIHISDQFPGSIHKKVIRFKFLLPSASKMGSLEPLMQLVFVVIDAVGLYKLTPHAKQKSGKHRAAAKEKEAKSAEEERLNALREKKAEQKAKERAKMTPSQIEKEEEKEKQRLMKRRMKVSSGGRR
mmetsp:Transcript_215/g.1598  ORF Transcript_215/g.1598 Transcript_215/m.1598 type:complete len:412 (-) Transcript_215:1152-2387(-)